MSIVEGIMILIFGFLFFFLYIGSSNAEGWDNVAVLIREKLFDKLK